MKKVHIIIIAAALLAIIFLYPTGAKKSIFTEKVGDMTLTRYETGETAAQQISRMYGLKDIPLEKAYSAVYKSKRGAMWMWVAEAPDHNIANDAYNSMNSMFGGKSGHEEHEYSGDGGQTDSHEKHNESLQGNNFTTPVKLEIMEFEKPEVFVMNADHKNNYYYFKMNYNTGRIYWIIFDSYDLEYEISIVKQAVMDI